ncbi:MAG: RNA 2',3'-cyclic phosphodiesterase [Granulosicoccus sp.]|nr:RNA 2',3'-cyclic phosphodiesterase [Granulosicoccus sp.]
MRVFLCIAPDSATAIKIDRWCTLCWPALDKPIPIQNYHITTAFLGELNDHALKKLSQFLDGFSQSAFEVCLDDVGYWPDSGALWLGTQQESGPLIQLHRQCKNAANKIGAKGGGKRYQPHLTLARKLSVPPHAALVQPEFKFSVDALQLWSSTLQAKGAIYREMGRWRLH